MIPQSEPHVRAVLEMLRDGLPPIVGVDLGVGPAKEPPFIAVYPDIDDATDRSLSGDRSLLILTFALHAVGIGPEQAIWASDRARAVLLGDPPVVPGHKVKRLRQERIGGRPVYRDESVQPPVYVAYSAYRLISQAVGPEPEFESD